MSTVQEKEYTVLMTFPVDAVHKTTVWASDKDDAQISLLKEIHDEEQSLEYFENSEAFK